MPGHVIYLTLQKLSNQSYLGTVHGAVNMSGDVIPDIAVLPVSGCDNSKEYDATGALYYVVVVIFVFGFSIVLMIASSVKKTRNKTYDTAVSKYMKDMVTIKRQERREEKFKFRMAMEQRRKKKCSLTFVPQDSLPESIREEDVSEQESIQTFDSLNREDASLTLDENIVPHRMLDSRLCNDSETLNDHLLEIDLKSCATKLASSTTGKQDYKPLSCLNVDPETVTSKCVETVLNMEAFTDPDRVCHTYIQKQITLEDGLV